MESETVLLAGHPVHRVGFGAMQLPGAGVFGPPPDRGVALGLLRRAIEAGVDHIDTAQFYGPDVANELIHEALHPYPRELVLVSKVGAARGPEGQWHAALRPAELRAGVEANLRSLELSQLALVNLRRHPDSEVPLAEQIDAMTGLLDEGLIGAIGLSNVTHDDYSYARSRIEVSCVQNAYNLASRTDQSVFEACRDDGVPFVPFFPLGSAFLPDKPVLGNPAVQQTARRLDATPAQVALAWLLLKAPKVLLIPGTSSPSHLEENLAVDKLDLDEEALAALDGAAS